LHQIHLYQPTAHSRTTKAIYLVLELQNKPGFWNIIPLTWISISSYSEYIGVELAWWAVMTHHAPTTPHKGPRARQTVYVLIHTCEEDQYWH